MATPLLWTASLWAETWLLHLLFNHGTWEVLGPCIKVPHHTPSRCLLRQGRVTVCRCCGAFCLLSYQPVAGGSKEQRAHVFNMESPRPKKMDGPVTGAQSRNSHEVHQLQNLCFSFTFLLKYLESHALAPDFPHTWLQRHPRYNPVSPALLSLP